jgi:hypothetical protein
MSKYTEYYVPVTTVLTETLELIKELVENDPWRDIGSPQSITLRAIYDTIAEAEGMIESMEDDYIKSFPMP